MKPMKEGNKNMESNIFYLLGAGASVMQDKYSKKACLPLSNDFVEKIEKLMKLTIDVHEFPTKTKEILDKIDLNISGLNQSVKDFLEEISKFGTIDEAMRYYYLNDNKSQFEEFKHTISTIFYIFENIEQFRDPRYKQFLMTLIENKKFTLPKKIKILSWNYDNQFEHACNEIQDNSNKINILNSDNYIKINGSASFEPIQSNILIPESTNQFQSEIENFENFRQKPNKIDFAWEEEFNSKFIERLENLKKVKSEKAILNVIGYSFPFINHKYDLEILETINPSTVYYQNIFDQTEVLQERFDKPFKFINDCSRFYTPKEMYDGYNKNYGNYHFSQTKNR
jgi:hypothetical protein